MRFGKILVLAALLTLGIGSALANYLPLRADVQDDRPQVTLLSHDSKKLELEVRLPGIELLQGTLEGKRWDRVEILGGGFELELGAPEVPNFTKLLAIPARAGMRAEFAALETETLTNVDLMPAQGGDPEDLKDSSDPIRYDRTVYSRDAFYPSERVTTGEPALMRGWRVAALTMNPVQYNPVTRELRVAHHFRVTVHFEGTDLRNVPQRQFPISRSWAKLLSRSVINFDEQSVDEQVRGSYLIVCENDANLINNILPPLVDWKKRKGHTVAIQTFTPGASQNTILSLIQNAYNTWEIPPEYVLLFGDVDGDYALPGWTVGGWPWGYDQIDHPYSQLEGGDILADVAVGRIPAGNATEATTMINKVLFYEKMPYTSNSDWYHQGVLIAGSSLSGISTIQVNRWIKTRMVWNEYTRIDTFWYNMAGSVAGTLTPAINNGVLYAHYRGCYLMENFSTGSIDNLTNGRKLPFVVTITCGTGGFAGSSESLMEHFVSVGTPTTPKGAIAAVGTATENTHTRQNNTLSYGTFAGIFDEGITQAGNALNRGKLELYNTFEAHDPGSVDEFSKYAVLAGDPGVELFTKAIQYMICDVPASVNWGENTLSLTVSETGVGPLPDAVVCLYKPDNNVQVVALTDANGQVTLPLNVTSAGNVKVTITKQNFYPIVDSLDVVQAAVAVGYYSHSIDDDNQGGSSGDNDHIINPGESVQIPLVFKNYGSSTTATGISVAASESDALATLSNATQTFSNLAPGATGNSSGSLLLTVAPNCPDGHSVRLDFQTTSNQGSWAGVLDLGVVSYDMTIIAAYASGSDTLLSPGETANFLLGVRNNGSKAAASLTAMLTSLDSYVTVNDAFAAFGTVNMGATATCTGNPFNLTAAGNAPPGHQANLLATFSANGATQTDTLAIALGNKTTADPQGPDEYGYYCFDNTDLNYAQAPTYNWIEIDPAYGGSGTQLSINDPSENADASVNVSLPFTFRYYGENVNAITVCSNGWISTWANNSFTDFRNYPIPSPIGPNGMIAPFWDDLITWSSGHVFSKNDAANHRFIVEWSRLKTLGSPQPQEVFEVVLFDPAYYPTSTGDGKILFQYNSITEVYGVGDDIPYSTVGIERPDQQDGIEIVYWNTYEDPAAAHLQNGRAYLFTTDFSYNPPGVGLYVTLTPFGTPIVIPPAGGTVNYNILGGNSGSAPASADIWCMVTLPNGSSFGPTLGPVYGFNFAVGWSTNRDRTLNVPGSAPAGAYTYHAYVGLYPNTVYDEDSFPFSKSGGVTSNSEADSGLDGWQDIGEPFEVPTQYAAPMIPANYALHPAHPNPFNPTTTIGFALPQASPVKLAIYDLRGRLVARLVNGMREAGTHEVVWDASNQASGLYFYRFEAQPSLTGSAGNYSAVGKLMLIK